MRRPSSWASDSMALTAISSQVDMSPRRLACWSPREVRNRNPPRFSSDIHSRIENGLPSSGRNSSAERLAVSMARTESAVLGFSGSTMDCATVPSIACASAVSSVLSRWSTRTLLRVSPSAAEHAGAVGEELARRRHPERDRPCPSAAGSARRPSCRSRAGCAPRRRATSAAPWRRAGSAARRGPRRRRTGCSSPSCRRSRSARRGRGSAPPDRRSAPSCPSPWCPRRWCAGSRCARDTGCRRWTVGPEPALGARQAREQLRRCAGLDPAAQLGGGDHFRAPDALLPAELRAPPPERGEEQPDQPGAGRAPEHGAREHFGP